jgi:hypothetical protein
MIRFLTLLLCVFLTSCIGQKAIQVHVNAATMVTNATTGIRVTIEGMRQSAVAKCSGDEDCISKTNIAYRQPTEVAYYFELTVAQWRDAIALYQADGGKVSFELVVSIAGQVVVAFDSMSQIIEKFGLKIPNVPGLQLLCLIVPPDSAKKSHLCGQGMPESS